MPNCRTVACPGSFLGSLHHCTYDLSSGRWCCNECGLEGGVDGFTRLIELEAERHGLQIELEICRFEQKLSGREQADHYSVSSVDDVIARLEELR